MLKRRGTVLEWGDVGVLCCWGGVLLGGVLFDPDQIFGLGLDGLGRCWIGIGLGWVIFDPGQFSWGIMGVILENWVKILERRGMGWFGFGLDKCWVGMVLGWVHVWVEFDDLEPCTQALG